ncbi:MAG: hypothetical protein IJ685_05220 [Selenomonadaceae bacterium]|nr:hypothetical protein [Selenomonadaceae bacterium]
MYKIINANGGAVIGRTETPRFIRKKISTGCFVNAAEKDAQGIAFQSKPYNLQGRDGVGAEKTVILVEFDLGTIADKTDENSAAIDNIIISMLGV